MNLVKVKLYDKEVAVCCNGGQWYKKKITNIDEMNMWLFVLNAIAHPDDKIEIKDLRECRQDHQDDITCSL